MSAALGTEIYTRTEGKVSHTYVQFSFELCEASICSG